MNIPEEWGLSEDIIGRLQKPAYFQKEITEGRSLQDIIGYSDDLMQKLYESALEVYNEKRYLESADGFLFLTTLNPFVYAYWLGLAMSQQCVEEYEQAIIAYECAASIEPKNPVPDYYIAACHFLLNEPQEWQEAISRAEQKCTGEHLSFLNKVLKAKDRLR